MTETNQLIGLAQLSLVGVAPPQLVRIAAEAGFDFIGARVRPVTPTERPYNVQPGTPMLAETLQAVKETGVGVKDIEFLLLDGSDQRPAWLEMMEAGQALSAESLTVASALEDEQLLIDVLGQMTEDGKNFGIMPTLEVISYQKVNSLALAVKIAQATGCKIVADTLHLSRVGTTDAELTASADLIPMLQLCDGPAQAPADREGLVHESRSERGLPGEGDFRLAEMVAALPADLPLSVEAPSDSRVAAHGELAWAKSLKEGADAVVARANELRKN